MSILRDYQHQAGAAFWDALSTEVNRVAIEMATGLGKTITFAGVIDEWLERIHAELRGGKYSARTRALVLVERDELARQAVEKIRVVTRGRWSIGVVKAQQNETLADIVVASVPTLRQRGRKEQITDVGLIVVDECHHAVAKSYMDVLEYYGAMHPVADALGVASAVPVLGVTATLSRADGQGLGRVWQDLAFSRSLPWAIRKGHLIDLIPYTIKIPDVDAGATDAELDAVLAEGIAPEAVVWAWAEKARGMCQECKEATDQVSGDAGYLALPGYCPDETCNTNTTGPSTVLFAPLVRSAEAFAAAFSVAGVEAEVVAGSYSDAHNEAVEARFRAGVTTVVCNAMKWTEGLDIPRIGCVIVARPTKSVELFVQMVGRGLRPWLDAEAPPREEQRCILLCVQGTAATLATVADLSDKIGEVSDGKSLLEMEDQWDIGAGIEDAPELYRGPVRVEQWDALVQRSSKAWKYTAGGAPYLPTAKRQAGYVFIVERGGQWLVFARSPWESGSHRTERVAAAPDLELAMAIAEDEAQERGGDIGALLADKGRAWRKGVPSAAAQQEAQRLGLGRELIQIMESRASGKAGKLSDLIDKVTASRVLDPIVARIKARSEGWA